MNRLSACTRRIQRLVSIGALTAILLTLPAVAHASGHTVVHPNDLDGWTLFNEDLNTTNGAPSGTFVNGPGTPLAGLGSFQQLVDTGDKQTIRTANHNGTPLADLIANGFSFATFSTDTAPTILTTAVNISVDIDGNGLSDRTLVMEPYEQPSYGGSQATATGVWQTWNLATAKWWSTCNPMTCPGEGVGGARRTLSEWMTSLAAPTATLALLSEASVRLVAGSTGSSWPTFDGNVDDVVIDGVAYDFETFVSTIDCTAIANDIAAVQAAVNAVPNGSTIRLGGTCDFSGAPAHGGDQVSITNTAVLIKPGTPIDGLTITSDGAPQSATILGSGLQTAFTVAPGNDNVTITGLRFQNFARPIVAINSDRTTIGSPGGIPSPNANRIIGGASMNSSILGLAIAQTPGSGVNTIRIGYGTTGSQATFSNQHLGSLTNFHVVGNYISYQPPGSPTETTDVFAIDVRQRFATPVVGLTIEDNAVGMFASEFPITNMAGVAIHSYNSVSTSTASDYLIRDVEVLSNNLGRLEEVGQDAGDVHATGRVGILLIGVGDFDIRGNGVRTRVSPTGVPMPGGGIIVSDSGFGLIDGNGIIVVADRSTRDSDVGAIGVVENFAGVFTQTPKAQRATDVEVRNNTVGPVTNNAPGLGGQRGIVVNGATRVNVHDNNLKFTSDAAINIGVLVQGPGSPSNPGPFELDRPVTASSFCSNTMAGIVDDAAEIAFETGTGNRFPTGGTFSGNAECTPPAVPSILAPAQNALRNTAAVAVSGTAQRGGLTITVRKGATTLGTSTSAADGTWSLTTPALADGSHTITATATDAVGQQSAATAGRTFVVDTIAPAAPVIVTPAQSSLTNNANVTVSGTTEPNATVEVRQGTSTIALATANASGNWSVVRTFSDGQQQIAARAVDPAGNTGALSGLRTFNVDTVAPAVPVITTPSHLQSLNSSPVTIGGTAEPGSTVTVREGVSVLGTNVANGSGAWSISASLPDGDHTVTARATDPAGNTGGQASRTFSLDAAPPAAPVIQVPAEGATITSHAVTFSGTAEPHAQITVREGATIIGQTAASGSGTWTMTRIPSVGAHAVTATARDDAGNVSVASPVRSFTFAPDMTPPAKPVITSPADGALIGGKVSITGTAEAGSTVVVRDGAATLATLSASSGGSWSLVVSLTDGTHTLTATATDAAGNVSDPSDPVTIDVDPTAPLSTITTANNSVFLPGQPVTIAGTASDNRSVVRVALLLRSPVGEVFFQDATLTPGPGPSVSWTVTLEGIGPGPYTFRATAYDAAGLSTADQIGFIKIG